MKPVLFIIVSLLISFSVAADTDSKNNKKVNESESISVIEKANAIQLTGSVVDKKNNEMLAGASILVNGKKYYSDLDGQFVINDVTPGKYEMVVELISYEPQTLELDLTRSQNLSVDLNQQ